MIGSKSNILSEKYRPKNLDQIIGNTLTLTIIKEYVKKKNIPHLLLYGPSGVGKTTTFYCILNELYGKYKKFYYKEINGSEEGTIDKIREIKKYCQNFNPKFGGIKDVEFGLVFIDEADKMPNKSQPALRRIMENYAHKIRFVFCCNELGGMIDAIQSRCNKHHYKSIKPENMMKRLQFICKTERISIMKKALTYLISKCNGDMRGILNALEEAKVLSAMNPDRNLTIQDLNVSIGLDKESQELLLACLNLKFDKAHNKLMDMLKDGWELRQLLKSIIAMTAKSTKLNSMQKVEICLISMNAEQYILRGGDSFTVGNGYISEMIKSLTKIKRKSIKNEGKKTKKTKSNTRTKS